MQYAAVVQTQNIHGCVDIFQYMEVDQILDRKNVPWDLPADYFETIYVNHVIEHEASVPEFLNEVHGIAKKATV